MHEDNDSPVCVDLDSENWEDNVLAQVGQNDETQTASEEVEEVDYDDDDDTPMKVQTYKHWAIQSLKEVQQFLYSKGHTHEAIQIDTSVDALVSLQLASTKQTTLTSRNFNLDTHSIYVV